MGAAEIGFDDGVLPDHGFRRAAGDDMALVEDQDALGQRHDHFHDVLDDDDGDAHVVDAPHQRDRRLQFGRRQAGKQLVEQQQARLGGEHAGDFEALASRRAERARPLIAAQSGQLDDATGLIAGIVAMRMPQERADHHVLQHRHVFERDRHLEGATDAGAGMNGRPGTGHVLAVEDDAAGGRQGLAGEAIEEGRFAGAVRADQADDLVLVHGEIGARHRKEAAERF